MKRLAIILAVVIAVLAIAVAAAPFVIPSDFLRQQVAERIAALTGRTVTVGGPTSLSIYPYFGISVGQVAIANPEDMGDDAMVTAPRLDTRIRPWMLLLGRVEFDEFVLTNPTIHLVVDAKGRPNWNFATGALRSAAPAAGGAASDVRLGHLVVENGTVLYDNRVSSSREEMREVDLDIDWPSASTTASGRGRMQWRDEPVEFTALVATPMPLLTGGTSAARFAIAATPLRVSFNGRATNAGHLYLTGEGSVSTPSMRRTIEWLGTPMGTGPILGAASIQGTAAISARGVDFSKAELELDGNSAQGSLGVAFDGEKPRVTGKLDAQRLDLSAYLEALRSDFFASGTWLITPARLPFAEAIDADLSFSTADMLVGAAEIRDTWSTVKIDGGALDLVLQGANLYDGQIGAHLTATPTRGGLAAQLHLDAKDVPAGPALSGLTGISALEGMLTGSMDLAASGRGWGEIANTIAGGGKFTVDKGKLNGIYLPGLAYVLADPFADPVAANGGVTEFNDLTAAFTLAGADISTSDLFMEGDDFHLFVTGHGSLTSGATEGRGTLTTSTESIPITLSGSWHAPSIGRVAPR